MKEAIEAYAGYSDPLSALSMACRDRCADLGISSKRWLLTERKFGLPTAALFIAVIDQNSQRPEHDPYHARDPQKCLSGMTWKCAKGRMNLAGMIAEIKKSAARRDRQTEGGQHTFVATLRLALQKTGEGGRCLPFDPHKQSVAEQARALVIPEADPN